MAKDRVQTMVRCPVCHVPRWIKANPDEPVRRCRSCAALDALPSMAAVLQLMAGDTPARHRVRDRQEAVRLMRERAAVIEATLE
jgi:hypothetical protein